MVSLTPLLVVALGWMPFDGLLCGPTVEGAGGEGARVAQRLEVGRSVVAEPGVAEALADFRAGRISRAREKALAIRAGASAGTAAALDFLVARCDLRLGRRPEADSGFAFALARAPALRDAVAVDRILVAQAGEDEVAFERAVGELSPGAARFPEFVLILVKRLLDAGRAEDALVQLGRLDGQVYWRWNQSRVAKWRADAQLDLDQDRAAWLVRMGEVWRRWPGTTAAREAESALLGQEVAPLGLEELVDAAVERVRGGDRDGARRLVRAAKGWFGREATGLPTLVHLWRHPVAWSRRTIREADEALALATNVAIRDHLELRKVRALRRGGRSVEAVAAFEKLGASAAGAHRGAAALLEGAELAGRLADWEAARRLNAAFVERSVGLTGGGRLDLGPGARVEGFVQGRARAMWSQAWAAYRLGDWAGADRVLARLAAEHGEVQDRSRRSYRERALYWRARVASRLGDQVKARAGWRALRRDYPHSYYATMAGRQLLAQGQSIETLGAGGDDREWAAPRPWQVRPVERSASSAVAMYRVGMVDEARAELRRAYDLGRLGPRGIELVSAIYREKPDWWRSHWIIQHGDPLDASPDGAERPRWLAAYPTPYRGTVLVESKEHGIDPLLIWSVMRQESAFRVRARSSASALGLMQVLLPTAKLVARHLREREPSLEQVLTRRGNVHYGTAYLRHLLAYFDGNLVFAIAGYNAGPGAVDRWRTSFGRLALDEFVEQIPYDETRGYTRKVLRSYAAYQALYGAEGTLDPWSAPRIDRDRKRPAWVARR